MPTSTLRWRTFNEKKPYFIATVFSLVAVAFAVGFLFQKLAESKDSAIYGLEPRVAQLQAKAEQFDRAYRKMLATSNEVNQVTSWMEQRYYWGDLLSEMRRVLIRSEDDIKKKLSAQKPGIEAGVWIEQLTMGGMPVEATGRGMNPGGVRDSTPPPPPVDPNEASVSATLLEPGSTVTLVCRAVNLSAVDSAANTDIAYAVLKAFQEDPLFDSKTTQLRGDITPDDTSGTFTFGITVGLKTPLNL